MTDPQTPATALPRLSVRTAATELLGAIDKHDNANIHGWSVALRAALVAATPTPMSEWLRDHYTEGMAAEPPALDVERLRKALVDVLRVFDAPFATSQTTRANIRRRAEAALAAEPPAPLDYGPLMTAVSVLLAISKTIMPEVATCGHDRRWLLSVLDDVAAEYARLAHEEMP